MKNYRITRVRCITKGKTINGVAKTVNIMVIDLAGGLTSIVRPFKVFLQDLKNSFLIDEGVESIKHPQVRKILRGLKRGMVTGVVQFTKAGDKWKVTENSRCITDSDHPRYGKVSIGDMETSEKDNAIVDGFLDFELNDESAERSDNADALASAKLAIRGVFDDYSEPIDDSEIEAENAEEDDEIHENIISGDKSKK